METYRLRRLGPDAFQVFAFSEKPIALQLIDAPYNLGMRAKR
jgi:hypothetical protein